MTMASGKCAAIFFLKIFIILPIISEARYFHGYDSYKQYYLSRGNANNPLKPAIASDESEVALELHFDRNDDAEDKVIARMQDAHETKPKNKGSNFVFPDEIGMQARNGVNDEKIKPIILKSQPDPRLPCRGKTFCEEAPNYPTELVNRALANDSSLMNYAIIDDADIIAQRIDSNELQLCFSSVNVILPRMGKNVHDQWMYIVQSEKSNFTQAIRVDVCTNEGNACEKIDGFTIGYKTRCKQKFIYRQLSVVSDDGNIVRSLFPIPASCCCHLFWEPSEPAS